MTRLSLISLVTTTVTSIILMGFAPSVIFVSPDKLTVNQLVEKVQTNDLILKNKALRK